MCLYMYICVYKVYTHIHTHIYIRIYLLTRFSICWPADVSETAGRCRSGVLQFQACSSTILPECTVSESTFNWELSASVFWSRTGGTTGRNRTWQELHLCLPHIAVESLCPERSLPRHFSSQSLEILRRAASWKTSPTSGSAPAARVGC